MEGRGAGGSEDDFSEHLHFGNNSKGNDGSSTSGRRMRPSGRTWSIIPILSCCSSIGTVGGEAEAKGGPIHHHRAVEHTLGEICSDNATMEQVQGIQESCGVQGRGRGHDLQPSMREGGPILILWQLKSRSSQGGLTPDVSFSVATGKAISSHMTSRQLSQHKILQPEMPLGGGMRGKVAASREGGHGRGRMSSFGKH